MRTPALILTVLAVALMPAPARARGEESAEKIKELRKERIATLKRVVEVSMKLAQNARLEVWEAMEDRMTLLKAEVEAAEKESDRVTLYKDALTSLKAYEAIAQARFEAGRGTELAVLKLRAKQQEIQIQLEQAKVKEAGGGK